MENFPKDVIDKTIESINRRIGLIIKCQGQRTKYYKHVKINKCIYVTILYTQKYKCGEIITLLRKWNATSYDCERTIINRTINEVD